MARCPPVRQAMPHRVTTVASDAARRNGRMTRQRACDGTQVVPTLPLGGRVVPPATPAARVAMARDRGASMSGPGWCARFTDAAVAGWRMGLQAAMTAVIRPTR